MFIHSVLIRASLFMGVVKHGGLRLFTLAVVLASYLAFAPSAANPVMPTYAQGPELEVTSTIPIPAEISASVVETLRSRPANILPGDRLIITSLDQNSGWALMTVAVRPSDPYEDILANSTIMIAKSGSGGWSSAIMGTDAYETLLAAAPTALVPIDSKPLLSARASLSPSAPEAIGTSLRWPWASNATWKMLQGPHAWDPYRKDQSGNSWPLGPNSSLDFGPTGSDSTVHAAASGTAIRKCQGKTTQEIIIRHPTGTSTDDVTGYMHLDLNGPSVSLGTWVNGGDLVGKLYDNGGAFNDHPCGAGSGPHLHFWVGTIPTNGTVTPYLFDYGNIINQKICDWQMQGDGKFHRGLDSFYTNREIPGACSSSPVPRPPSNLSAAAVSSSQINLSWSGSPDSVDGYRIWSGGAIVANNVTNTSYSFSGFSSCSTYSFYVTAYKGDLPSSASNTASAKTSGCLSGAPSAPSLNSPSNGQVFPRFGDISLVWNSNGSYRYLVEFWGGPDGGKSNLGWQSGTSLFFGNGNWGGNYSWHVRAQNSSGQASDWGETRTFFKKYGTPGNVGVSALSDTQARLTWSASADAPGNIEGYEIYRDNQLRATVGSGATLFDDYDLNCDSSYSYYLKAYKGNGESDASSTVSVTTNGCPPPGPSANFDAWPQSGAAPLVVAMHIVDTSNIHECIWDYGDGQTGASCASSHNHTYNGAGSFTVKLTVDGPGGRDTMTRNGYINVSSPGTPDPRQEGPVAFSGTLQRGNTAYFTVNVKNYGSAATPATHPYIEGTNSAGQFWRADGAQPGSAVIQPGQTVSFQVQQSLGATGTWTASGIYLWDNDAGTYWKALPANGQNQQFSFTVTEPGTLVCSSTLLFRDDFSDPSTGWGVYDTTSTSWGYAGGEYRILAKQPGYFSWASAPFGFSAYSVALDARYEGAVAGEYALLFGLQTSPWKYYAFEVMNGAYRLSAIDLSTTASAQGEGDPSRDQARSILEQAATPEAWTVLVDWTQAPALNRGAARNRLEVRRRGTQADLYANGTFLTTVNDSRFVGNLGIGVLVLIGSADPSNIDFRFDNLEVRSCASAPTCYNLTKTPSPSAGGQITADPAPNCQGSTQYVAESVIKVDALPSSGYTFGNWSGAISGTQNPARLQMGADRSLTAVFVPINASQVRAFVRRFYQQCLNREPDQAGWDAWTNALVNGSMSGADLAQAFIFSQEFINRRTSNDEFLRIMYHAFFNREPDSGGYNAWLSALNNGMSRQEVLNGFTHSQEFANLCDAYGIKAVFTQRERIEAFVTRFYQQCLNRQPDAGGLKAWTDSLLSGAQTGADVARGFIFSQEFTNRNTSHAEFLTIMYRAFFAREPDSGGYNAWLNALNGGTSRADVLKGFTHSTEFANLCRLYGIRPF